MILRRLLDFFFPPVCASCKKEGDFLCQDCISGFRTKKIQPLSKREGKARPTEFHHLDGLIYALDYARNPQISAAIHQFKYRFTRELVNYFADLMAAKLGELEMLRGKQLVLIPVPLHRKRLNQRGFNQAELIANSIQGSAEVMPLLARTKNTAQQAKLSRIDRQKNLDSAFTLNFPYHFDHKNRIYFLVDDVCTTGATLENCAKTLKLAGAKRVYGLVIARAFK